MARIESDLRYRLSSVEISPQNAKPNVSKDQPCSNLVKIRSSEDVKWQHNRWLVGSLSAVE